MNNILNLTKELISIPSWVGEGCDESAIGEYIFKYLKENTSLTVTKQAVTGRRFNIIASNSNKIETLIIGHIDTVPVDNNWDTDPFTPTIIDNRLYGRGSTDMKSGIAAMLVSANNLPVDTALLFYVDEEYNFLGMKKFIAGFGNKIKPKTIISLDGSELEISNGCRGLIEINFDVIGKSCHAATPQFGINAINSAVILCQKLEAEIKTPINIGLISGGIAPNVVAPTCAITIDIRPSQSTVNANFVVNKMNELAKIMNIKVINIKVNYDFGSWLTPKEKLSVLSLPFKDITQSGYIDMQLLWEKFDMPTCFTIGAGSQKSAHTANEFVEIAKLDTLPQILLEILKQI